MHGTRCGRVHKTLPAPPPATSPPIHAPPPLPHPPRRDAFEGVASLLRAKFPGCGVSVFGSAANALGIRDNNDIDMSMSLEGLGDTREVKGGSEGMRNAPSAPPCGACGVAGAGPLHFLRALWRVHTCGACIR